MPQFPYWIKVDNGVSFYTWEGWVDCLFDLGITNPGPNGFMADDDGIIYWGSTLEPQDFLGESSERA